MQPKYPVANLKTGLGFFRFVFLVFLKPGEAFAIVVRAVAFAVSVGLSRGYYFFEDCGVTHDRVSVLAPAYHLTEKMWLNVTVALSSAGDSNPRPAVVLRPITVHFVLCWLSSGILRHVTP